MKSKQALSLIVLSLTLLFFLCISPSLALDSPNFGVITDGQSFQDDYLVINSGHGVGAAYGLDGLYFNKIESIATMNIVKFWSYYPMGGTDTRYMEIYNKSLSNNSYIPVTYYEHASHALLGTGKMGYSLTSYNKLYGYFTFDSWNIGSLTGPTLVDIYNSGSDTLVSQPPFTWYFTTWGNHAPDFSSSKDTNVYLYTSSATIQMGGIYEREIDYTNMIEVSYIRTPSYPLDSFAIDRTSSFTFKPSLSNIIIQSFSNGSYITLLNDTSTTNIDSFPVTNGTPQKLIIINPITNHEFDYIWGLPIGTMNLHLNKTQASLNEGVEAQASWQDSAYYSHTYSIQWVDSDCHTHPNTCSYLTSDEFGASYKYISGTWYKWNTVSGGYTIPVSDSAPYTFDTYFTFPSAKHYIYITAYDENSNQIGFGVVYINIVGSQFFTFVVKITNYQTGAQLNDAIYSLQDLTDDIYIQNSISLPSGIHSDYIRANHVFNITASHSGYVTKTQWFTMPVSDYSLTIPLEPSTTINATSTQINFYVYSDINHQNLVSGALVSLSSGEQSLTNNNGYVSFTLNCSGTDEYTISKTGYTSVSNVIDLSIMCGMSHTYEVLLPLSGEVTPTPTGTITICTPSNPVEAMYCTLDAYGIKSRGKQDIALSFLVMTFLGVILAIITRDATGALAGAGLGMALCWGLGLLQTWFIVGCLAIFGLVLILREVG